MKLDFNGFVNKLRVFVTVDHDRCRPIETCGLTALMVPRSLGVFFFLGGVINRIRSTTYSKKISKNLHIWYRLKRLWRKGRKKKTTTYQSKIRFDRNCYWPPLTLTSLTIIALIYLSVSLCLVQVGSKLVPKLAEFLNFKFKFWQSVRMISWSLLHVNVSVSY